MLRALLVGLCRFLLRVFFRRIEIVGSHRLPEDGALLFTLNHPSGLIDPLFILCLSGRRVSFLAKEPLFRMPIVGLFVKAFESLPVYRTRDGGDPKKNREMMRAAADLLASGNALALFPEGTSHSDPQLKRFRSGAARIALSARALSDGPVRIVPGALYYERKQTFRSRAVLAFGDPIDVPLVELDEAGDSPIAVGKQMTTDLEAAIRNIMPTADTVEGLLLAEQAERVFSAALRDSPDECPQAAQVLEHRQSISGGLPLGERMARRRRLIDAYWQLIEHHPQAINHLIERIQSLQNHLEQSGLAIDAPPQTPAHLAAQAPALWSGVFLLSPLAIPGIVLHAPAYQLIRWIAFRVAAGAADVTATVKLIAGALFFLVTWVLLGAGAAWLVESHWGWFSAFLGPLSGWAALRWNEIVGALRRGAAPERRATAAGLRWDEIVQNRADIAENMAQLLRQA